ncbi:hypothetical protein PG994_007919 [Apiospora phragmitis]|uniref:Rhodopsin domain-containing protein n=1 Tax=Apiospora phragmitis TaxID=2905665 RepID=A0ABR1URJ7_9PEZI
MCMVFEGGLGLPEDIVKDNYGIDAGIAHAKAGYASLIGGVSAAYLCKISILSLYHRIFTLPGERRPFYAVAALTLLCGLSTFVGYFVIIPIAKQLDPRLKLTDAEKTRDDGFQLYTGIATCFTDVMILCFPLGKLYQLRMDHRRKIGLMATFMVGFITCIVAIIRTVATYVDLSNSATVQTLFRGLEPTIGIIAACLPLLHPLLRCSRGDSDRLTQKPARRWQKQQQPQSGAGIRKTVKVTVTSSRNGAQTTLRGWRGSNSSQEPLGAGAAAAPESHVEETELAVHGANRRERNGPSQAGSLASTAV